MVRQRWRAPQTPRAVSGLGVFARQAATRLTLRAVATSRCLRRVCTNPMERERRRPPRRVPWASVPSMPARRAYTFCRSPSVAVPVRPAGRWNGRAPGCVMPGARSRRVSVRSTGAGRTHGLTEGNTDGGMAMSVGSLPPHDAPLPLRADRVVWRPRRSQIGLPRSRSRPALAHAGRSQSGPIRSMPVLGTTRQEVGGGPRARIDQLFPRRQLAGRQGRLNGRQHRNI